VIIPDAATPVGVVNAMVWFATTLRSESLIVSLMLVNAAARAVFISIGKPVTQSNKATVTIRATVMEESRSKVLILVIYISKHHTAPHNFVTIIQNLRHKYVKN